MTTQRKVRPPHHMKTDWHAALEKPKQVAAKASLADRSTIVVRMGQLVLSSGTGAWRVRDTMNRVAAALGLVVHVDISLVSIEVTCIDGTETITEVVANAGTGVNTTKIMRLEQLLHRIEQDGPEWTVGKYHEEMDGIEKDIKTYAPWQTGLAAGFACASFVFLLSGGPIEMVCALFGAGFGEFLRSFMNKRHFNPLASVAAGVCMASTVYIVMLHLLALLVHGATDHAAGYIGAILFVVPGFPLITSGLDFFKGEFRSGIERLGWALCIIVTATAVGWLVAEFFQLTPDDFAQEQPGGIVLVILRLVFSFVGVFGFSVMFNSQPKMAAAAGVIGAIANTLRLSLVDYAAFPAEAATFIGALSAGLLAASVGRFLGFPRITTTVPSIVIMVPGLYMYRAMYMMGIFETSEAANWLVRAAMLVLFLPVGLITARVFTDRRWRYVS